MIFFYQHVLLFGIQLVFAETQDRPTGFRLAYQNMLKGITKVNQDRMNTLKKLMQLENVVMTKSDLRYLFNEELDLSAEDEAREGAIMTILDYLHNRHNNIRRAQLSEDVFDIKLHPLNRKLRATNGKIPIDETSAEDNVRTQQKKRKKEKIPITETSAEDNVSTPQEKRKKEKIPIDETSEEDNVPTLQGKRKKEKIPIDETSAEDSVSTPQEKRKKEKIPIDETSEENNVPTLQGKRKKEKIPIDETSAEDSVRTPQEKIKKEKIPIDETSEEDSLRTPQEKIKKKKIPIDETSAEDNVPTPQKIKNKEKIPIDETRTEDNVQKPREKRKKEKKRLNQIENTEKVTDVDPKRTMIEVEDKLKDKNHSAYVLKYTDALRKSWMKTVKKKGAKTCIKACKATHKNFCKLFSCSKRAKKMFVRECKLNCKAKFNGSHEEG